MRLDQTWRYLGLVVVPILNIMWLAGFLIGMVLGSLVKALADRSLGNQTSLSPSDKSFWGRSYCPKCQHKLAWYDLFPILSFVFLKGKCRYCRIKIGNEYLLVEVGMGILVAFLFVQSFSNFQPFDFAQGKFSILNFKFLIFISDLILKIFFICVLAALFLTDLKKMFIPDRIILPGVMVGIILNLIITISKVGYLYYSLFQTAIGRLLLPPHSDYFQRHALMIVQSFFWSLLTGVLIGGFFLSLIAVTKGKGMGGGDVKLGAFIGIMLGFPGALVALVLSFLTGAIFGVALIIAGKKHFGQTIPFGPFLVFGSLIVLFWGNRILGWYLQFI